MLEPFGHYTIGLGHLLHASQGPSSRIHHSTLFFYSFLSKLKFELEKRQITRLWNNLECFRFTCCDRCSTRQLAASQRFPLNKAVFWDCWTGPLTPYSPYSRNNNQLLILVLWGLMSHIRQNYQLLIMCTPYFTLFSPLPIINFEYFFKPILNFTLKIIVISQKCNLNYNILHARYQ